MATPLWPFLSSVSSDLHSLHPLLHSLWFSFFLNSPSIATSLCDFTWVTIQGPRFLVPQSSIDGRLRHSIYSFSHHTEDIIMSQNCSSFEFLLYTLSNLLAPLPLIPLLAVQKPQQDFYPPNIIFFQTISF